jgi:hypothetical protein
MGRVRPVKFQQMKQCIVCGQPGAERHHIKTRGSGGTDDEWNIMYLDRRHHQEVHQIGIITFTEKYEVVRRYLELNGWEIVSINNFKRLIRRAS